MWLKTDGHKSRLYEVIPLTCQFGFRDLEIKSRSPSSELDLQISGVHMQLKVPKSRRYEVIALTIICSAHPPTAGDHYTVLHMMLPFFNLPWRTLGQITHIWCFKVCSCINIYFILTAILVKWITIQMTLIYFAAEFSMTNYTFSITFVYQYQQARLWCSSLKYDAHTHTSLREYIIRLYLFCVTTI